MSDINKLLVVLDGSPENEDLIQAAASLASGLGAELKGLFVEDVTVYQLAKLPVAREVRVTTLTTERLDDGRVMRRIRGMAVATRRRLATVSSQMQINWTYDIRRGTVSAELASATPDADLVVLNPFQGRRLNPTTQHVLTETDSALLLTQKPLPPQPSILLIYDGSSLAEEALHITADITLALDGYLTVVSLAENDTQGARVCQVVAFDWLAERGIEARCRWITQVNTVTLVNLLQEAETDLLVTPGNAIQRRTLVNTLTQTTLSTLIV